MPNANTLDTFPDVAPDRRSSRTKTDRILKAPFGDGYEQTAIDGINSAVEEWKLSFEDYPKSDIDLITNFLDAHKSTRAFLWTPPDETVAKRWKQKGVYTKTFPGYNTRSLKVTLVRVYHE